MARLVVLARLPAVRAGGVSSTSTNASRPRVMRITSFPFGRLPHSSARINSCRVGRGDYFFFRRGSSLARHRSHGLARWASHSFWVGKVVTTLHSLLPSASRARSSSAVWPMERSRSASSRPSSASTRCIRTSPALDWTSDTTSCTSVVGDSCPG
jgi:hypothetical protein